ncbi:biotin/lipoyl-containing protein, partial [Sneathiella sp.]|uniref:biotin/lipoyl-containing protein n=1 Tax=Sneathiella sp. TaxID=1964365 RepID=UPI00260502FD
MPTEILMPALSPTMTEGKLTRWMVKEGDTVSSGDVLAEIETDKATMEVEAVDEGKIGKILIEGDTENVAVNTPIAVLLEEGEDDSDLDDFTPSAAPSSSSDSEEEADDSEDKESDAAPKPRASTSKTPDAYDASGEIPEGTEMTKMTVR